MVSAVDVGAIVGRIGVFAYSKEMFPFELQSEMRMHDKIDNADFSRPLTVRPDTKH